MMRVSADALSQIKNKDVFLDKIDLPDINKHLFLVLIKNTAISLHPRF
jgi:hypothetical protein